MDFTFQMLTLGFHYLLLISLWLTLAAGRSHHAFSSLALTQSLRCWLFFSFPNEQPELCAFLVPASFENVRAKVNISWYHFVVNFTVV